jgi:hypothetical protein
LLSGKNALLWIRIRIENADKGRIQEGRNELGHPK